MLRFGWGETGNQQIPGGRIVAQFGGGRGDTFYDISGSGSTIKPGYRLVALGNPNVKWETNKSTNVGLDLEFLQGRGNFTVDVYNRRTEGLLYDPRLPSTSGVANPAIGNYGTMSNKGVDFAVAYSGTLSGNKVWSVAFNGSHYKNKILRIDGVTQAFFGPVGTRIGVAVINQVGQPIGPVYGLQANGYFPDSVAAPGRPPNAPCTGDTAPWQGAAPPR